MQSLAEVHYPLLSHLIPLRVAFPALEEIANVNSSLLVLAASFRGQHDAEGTAQR